MTALEQQYPEIRGQLDRVGVDVVDTLYGEWFDDNPRRFAAHLEILKATLTPEYRARRARVSVSLAESNQRPR